MNEYLMKLMSSRNQAHVYHLQTNSYSKHEALQDYYEGIVKSTDEIAETYQGIYKLITNFPQSDEIKNLQEQEDILEYFEKLEAYVSSKRLELPPDFSLQHLLDEVDTLIASTIYKLKYLK